MNKIFTVVFLTIINLSFSQSLKTFKNVKELSKDEQKIYDLVKESTYKFNKTNDIHFFDIYSIREDEHYLYFQTYIYGKPKFSNCERQYSSATYLVNLSLEKVKTINLNDGVKTPNYSKSSPQNIIYSLDILDGSKTNNSFRENYLIRLMNKTPILNSKYKNGKYNESLIKNKIDENLFKNVKEVSYIDNQIAISNDNNNYGIINSKGKILLPFEYQNLKLTESGILATKKNKYYFIDITTFNKISDEYDNVNFKFDCYHLSGSDDVIKVEKNGRFTLLNKKLKSVLPDYYNELIISNKQILAKNENGKQILIKSNPLRETNIVYDEIINVDNNIMVVKNGNKFGAIDFNGNIVVPIEYDKLEYQYTTQSIVGIKNQKEFSFPLNSFKSTNH